MSSSTLLNFALSLIPSSSFAPSNSILPQTSSSSFHYPFLHPCSPRTRLVIHSSLAPDRSSIPDAQRIVVTGMGIVSPIGHDPATFYNNLLQGVSGVKSLVDRNPIYTEANFQSLVAAYIDDFDPDPELLAPKQARRLDRHISYAIVAGKKAMKSADIPLTTSDDEAAKVGVDKLRCGVLLGSAMGGMEIFENNCNTLNEKKSLKKLSPFTIPFFLNNMAGAILSMEKDVAFRGPCYMINTACATANYCFLAAADHIRKGEADIMLAGGTEAPITPMGMAGFLACKALSTSYNDAPHTASRPWDQGRDGFVMGEGAGVLVLESLQSAKRRGAESRIVAELIGGAISSDAYDLTSPRADGSEVARCMNNALKNSKIDKSQVDLVNAHGTSTPVGDQAELIALKKVFGGTKVKIHSTKSMTGHSLGAAGALEAIAAIRAIQLNKIHPTINHENPMEALEFDVVPNKSISMDVNVVLSNSFGFGGHNSSVVFAAYQK